MEMKNMSVQFTQTKSLVDISVRCLLCIGPLFPVYPLKCLTYMSPCICHQRRIYQGLKCREHTFQSLNPTQLSWHQGVCTIKKLSKSVQNQIQEKKEPSKQQANQLPWRCEMGNMVCRIHTRSKRCWDCESTVLASASWAFDHSFLTKTLIFFYEKKQSFLRESGQSAKLQWF